ncbi:MAG: MBL fold metallo-hydrolase [Sarcina sp.]
MNIYFNGDCSFLLETSNGKRILLDPISFLEKNKNFNPKVNLITISHNHNNINFKSLLPTNIELIHSKKDYNNDFCKIKTFNSFHDNHNGQKRGPNLIYKISSDGFYLCHLGHLGHKLTEDTLTSLKQIDVLFVPVGDYFSISLKDLKETIRIISPKFIIPMDYNINNSKPYLKSLDSFLLSMGQYPYLKLDFLDLNSIHYNGSPTIIILNKNKKKNLENF